MDEQIRLGEGPHHFAVGAVRSGVHRIFTPEAQEWLADGSHSDERALWLAVTGHFGGRRLS